MVAHLEGLAQDAPTHVDRLPPRFRRLQGGGRVSVRPCPPPPCFPRGHLSTPARDGTAPPGRARAPGGPGGSNAAPRASPGGRRARRPASAAAPRAAAGRWESAEEDPSTRAGGARVGARARGGAAGGAASRGRRRHAPSPPGPGRKPCWRACCRSTPSRRVGRPGPPPPQDKKSESGRSGGSAQLPGDFPPGRSLWLMCAPGPTEVLAPAWHRWPGSGARPAGAGCVDGVVPPLPAGNKPARDQLQREGLQLV